MELKFIFAKLPFLAFWTFNRTAYGIEILVSLLTS